MKRGIALIIALLAVTWQSVVWGQQEQTKSGPQMTFVSSMTHDFGDFELGGASKSHSFEFVNDGTAPLVIVRANSSCRCIEVKFQRKPIQPGQKGVVEVIYSPKDEGVFNKGVHIYSNIAGGNLTLFVKGVVE